MHPVASRSERVVTYKHSRSAGDGIVAGPGIETVADLAEGRVAVPANGPHINILGRIPADGGVGLNELEIVPTEAVTRRRRRGRLDAAARTDFAGDFEPHTFEVHAGEFEEIGRLASTHGGGITTAEGHADLLRREQGG